MAEKKYEERDQFPTLINGGQVDEAIVNTPPTEKGVFNTGITSTQIEQVVDLPIPTTDDEGKVLKVDAEGKWELAADAEGTVVVANPTLAGTEADLVGLQVGSTKYKVPEGMEVLELANSSGTLTDAQYELVSGNNCVIKYNTYTFLKLLETTLYIFYYCPYINMDADHVIHLGYNIQITKSNKAYGYLYEYTTKDVIANPTLAGTESALTGLQIGNTKYKVGAESPVAYEGTSLLTSGLEFSGWTLHRAIKDGNILWFVFTGSISNPTGADIQTNALAEITLPSNIASKIYRRDGTNVSEAYTSNGVIIRFSSVLENTNTNYRLYSDEINKVKMLFVSNETINANSSKSFDIRIPIFLDIGTVAS